MLNDNSGSPNILSLVIKDLILKGHRVDLFTSSVTGGFLGGIQGLTYHKIYYRFFGNKILTAFLFVIVQIRYFFSVFSYAGVKNVDIYINTILPFGAALSAKILKKRIIYHIHEYPVKMNIFQKIGIAVFLKCADKSVFVSGYLLNKYQLDNNKKLLVYNALSPDFTERAMSFRRDSETPLNIIMICSLKKYKGVYIFLSLAEKLPQYNFTLLLNSDDLTYRNFIKDLHVIKNLSVHQNITDLHPFYESADLLLNLSLPDQWVETFGLTVLEGLTYGIPAIVPPAGGVIELITNGYNGYHVNPYDEEKLKETIQYISDNPEIYHKLAENARFSAKRFSYTGMINSIEKLLFGKE